MAKVVTLTVGYEIELNNSVMFVDSVRVRSEGQQRYLIIGEINGNPKSIPFYRLPEGLEWVDELVHQDKDGNLRTRVIMKLI